MTKAAAILIAIAPDPKATTIRRTACEHVFAALTCDKGIEEWGEVQVRDAVYQRRRHRFLTGLSHCQQSAVTPAARVIAPTSERPARTSRR